MDYMTKGLSRHKIRQFALIFRMILKLKSNEQFPVLDILEKLPDIFKNSNYEIVSDDELDINVPAQCSENEDGGFEIKIKESVYLGARKGVGAYRDHITHELCHIFLIKMGYTPILQRSFKNGQIRNFESVEWQAKALCGEVMMPYDETKDMSEDEIVRYYGVSKSQAKYRKKY